MSGTHPVHELDVTGPDGRTLHVYDTGGGAGDDDRLPLLWHHGTPNIGLPPRPLFDKAAELGMRFIGYSRPGYPGSTRNPGRDVASTAGDARAVLDALGLASFATIGHSGGGENVLACAALLGDRCQAAVSISGLAPYDAPGLDWLAGFPEAGLAEMTAAREGREVLEALVASGALDELDVGFVPGDEEMFAGPWRWFIEVVQPAMSEGPGGMVDDNVAGVSPWGFDVAAIEVPVLVLHGEIDGIVPVSHGHWLGATIPGAELRVVPGAGHLSVMREAGSALAWLRQRVDRESWRREGITRSDEPD